MLTPSNKYFPKEIHIVYKYQLELDRWPHPAAIFSGAISCNITNDYIAILIQ